MPEWKPVIFMNKILMEPLGLIQYGGALGVSIFFMISGYLLASGVDSGKYTIKTVPRKILCIYIPMVLSYCSFFVFQKMLSILKYVHYFEQFSLKDWILGGSLLAYFTERGDVINGTMWYLIPTFIGYFLVCSFSKLFQKSVKISFIGIEIILGITFIIGRMLNDQVVLNKMLSYDWYVCILLFGLIFYYFENNKLKLKEFLGGIILNYLILISGAYCFAPGYITTEKYIISIIYAILFLVLALSINEKYDLKRTRIVSHLSEISLYIYLIHMPYGSLLISEIEQYIEFPLALLITLFLIFIIAVFHKKCCDVILRVI